MRPSILQGEGISKAGEGDRTTEEEDLKMYFEDRGSGCEPINAGGHEKL